MSEAIREIGIKDVYTKLPRIAAQAKRGQRFLVRKHGKPLFRIEPILPKREGKYTLEDLLSIRFHANDPHLSQKVDDIVYGDV